MMSYTLPASTPEETRGQVILNSSTLGVAGNRGTLSHESSCITNKGFFFSFFLSVYLLTYVRLEQCMKGQSIEISVVFYLLKMISNEC